MRGEQSSEQHQDTSDAVINTKPRAADLSPGQGKMSRRYFLGLAGGVAAAALLKGLDQKFGFVGDVGVEISKHEELLDPLIGLLSTVLSVETQNRLSNEYNIKAERNPKRRSMLSIIKEGISLYDGDVFFPFDPERLNNEEAFFDVLEEKGILEDLRTLSSDDLHALVKSDPSMLTFFQDVKKRSKRALRDILEPTAVMVLFGAESNITVKVSTENETYEQPYVLSDYYWYTGIVQRAKVKSNPDKFGYVNDDTLNEEIRKEIDVWVTKIIDSDKPVSSAEVLSWLLAANNGNLLNALMDVSLIFKLMARNNLDDFEYIPMYYPDRIPEVCKRFNNLVDEFSPLLGSFGSVALELGLGYDSENKDLSIINLVGTPYHNFNIALLLAFLPRSAIKLSVLGTQLAELDIQGGIKTIADFNVLRELKQLEEFFLSLATKRRLY